MVELLSSVAYGLVILPLCGLSVIPDARDVKGLCVVGLGHLHARVKFNYKFGGDDWATYKRRRGLTSESEPQCFCSCQRLAPPEGAGQEGTVWSTFWLWVDFVETAAALAGPSVPSGPMSRGRGVDFVGGSSRYGTFAEVY